MWLDELQRYLDGEHGLTGGVVRALLNAPHPAVIIGTIWPDRYAAYTAVPAPASPHARPAADPHAREREVLDLAEVVRIDPEFSPSGAGPGPRRRSPRPAAGDRAGHGRVRADPDPGSRAATGRPLAGRPRPPSRTRGRC